MRVPRLTDVQGVVEASDGGLPLVIRTARGFGQVIFVAADLDQSPLNKWVGPADAGGQVARHAHDAAVEDSKDNASMMHYGYGDLAGQLRSALDRFTGVRLVPFWLVAGLIIVYILLIGPGDYFFLRKVVRRMEWTWLTFPAIVALVCVGAYLLAYRLKGDQLRVNQIDLVDVDAASGRMRGTTWLNVFSPRMESFNFAVEPRGPDGGAAPRCSRVDGLARIARQRAGRHESTCQRTFALDRSVSLCDGPRRIVAACRSRCGRPRASRRDGRGPRRLAPPPI